LEDVPANLLVGKTRTGRPVTSFASSRNARLSDSKWTLPSPPKPFVPTQGAPAPVSSSLFHAGTRIKHPTWGEGMVLDSRIQDNDEIVDVVFESVGIKRLAASLANLTII